jgi:hypothetical protein
LWPIAPRLKSDRTYPNIQNTDRSRANKTDRLTTNLFNTKARLKMNITRVERDGVEFFTIDETGESGMSESGLARLCGVSPVSVHKFISNTSLTWEHEKALNPAFRKTIPFKPNGNSSLKFGQNTIAIVSFPNDSDITGTNSPSQYSQRPSGRSDGSALRYASKLANLALVNVISPRKSKVEHHFFAVAISDSLDGSSPSDLACRIQLSTK